MNHSEAIETNAAEDYLLDDLSETQREAFEEHYVDCRVCSDAISAGAAMLASGREVVEKEKIFRWVTPRSWIPASVASAAAAALIVVGGYQAVIIPRIQTTALAAKVLTPGGLFTGTTRAGESDKPIHFEGEDPVVITVDIPTDRRFPQYGIELREPSGKAVRASDVSAKAADREEGVPLLLSPLPAGRYVLVALGVRKDGNRSEVVASWRVVVQ